MRHIEDNIKEKRNKQYNKWARKYPSYISLIIPIILGILIGVDDYMESKVWGRAIIYIMSISTFSTALFFLLRFTLRDISKFYPGMIIFCDRLKPTSRMLYSNDSSYPGLVHPEQRWEMDQEPSETSGSRHGGVFHVLLRFLPVVFPW